MPTQIELRAALGHILNVFDQIGAYYTWRCMEENLSCKNAVWQVSMMRNAALESTLINLRTLNEFFKPNGRHDDIRAKQFPGYESQDSFLSEEDEKLIHKHLAHLSWQRVKDVSFAGWTPKKLMMDAIIRMLHFLDYLESQFLSFNDEEMVSVKRLKESLPALLPKVGIILPEHV